MGLRRARTQEPAIVVDDAELRRRLATPATVPCPQCEFMARSEAGLQTHITRRHAPPPIPVPSPPAVEPPPPPALGLFVEPSRFVCDSCGSSVFTSSIRDPRICIRCDLAARQKAA